jgi:hypothetical protein
MNVTQIDRILEARERAKLLGTIPEAQLDAAVAKALGISEDLVLEAIESESKPS